MLNLKLNMYDHVVVDEYSFTVVIKTPLDLYYAIDKVTGIPVSPVMADKKQLMHYLHGLKESPVEVN